MFYKVGSFSTNRADLLMKPNFTASMKQLNVNWSKSLNVFVPLVHFILSMICCSVYKKHLMLLKRRL